MSVSIGTPRSEARYWSLPPSVCPITTGRTPRRVIVLAANGVSAATRGAACAGAAASKSGADRG